MKKIDDFRLVFKRKEYVPIIVGGMGVDISTRALALETARLGGIGHISDALINAVSDRYHGTSFVKEKTKYFIKNKTLSNKSAVQFDLKIIEKATKLYVEGTMEQKKGDGLVFVNCMEKLTMNNPRGTLKSRLSAAMDAGIDGITLSAGLHLNSFSLIADHPRFRDVKLGIIVSSVRALQLFLKKAARVDRLPDYVVVEGPLAGGHLGFGLDWKKYNLQLIVKDVIEFIKKEELDIPIIPAGGIFTGSDGVEYLEMGASALQVATRFTVTKECGLPTNVKQKYFEASEEDVIVTLVSPTGYPLRWLRTSPAMGSGIRPNCESYGYLLDSKGNCAYIESYNREVDKGGSKISVSDKMCLCTHMRNYSCWVCGHNVYRVKDTTNILPDGSYQMLTAEQVFQDYQYSVDHKIALPPLDLEQVKAVKEKQAKQEKSANS